MGTRLGAGLANLVNAFNPQVDRRRRRRARAGRPAARAGREEVARRALAPSRDLVRIVPTRFGAESGMLGAAVMAFDRRRRPRLSGRLVVCPTPIGNLEDITLRVLSVLREADVVACEDTRRTRVLLDRYGVSATLVSYHEHNERERSAELVRAHAAGETVALVSDAGMPLVSDPGYVLVQACVAAGLAVEVLPGPSAALAALVASGLPAETLALRRLPAAQEGRARGGVRRDGDGGGLRVAAPRRGLARRAGLGRPGA